MLGGTPEFFFLAFFLCQSMSVNATSSSIIIILFLVTGHVMENHLLQLSVTEAVEVTDVCFYRSEVSSLSNDPNWNLSDVFDVLTHTKTPSDV